MSAPFSTRTYGKWILAGEHSVLRGCPALAFPLTSRYLEMSFKDSSQSLDVQFSGDFGADFKLLFYGVLENAWAQLKRSDSVRGSFNLFSSLPVGAGLGASAALCGAVARWCSHQGLVPESEIYDFARRLEDLFHGESSGVDLSVSLSGQGVRFVRHVGQTPVEPKWRPHLYLSYCGHRGITSECVAKVKRLFTQDSALAERLDAQMKASVDLAEKALQREESPEAFAELSQALELAHQCFVQWGLCEDDLKSHLDSLREAGAVAVKPTGSGGGGYALSLWKSRPPQILSQILVPAFGGR